MPHAEEKMSQTGVLTNGEHASKFVNHIVSYPTVSDGIATYKSNPYGAKSIEIAETVYEKVAKPLESPLARPYSLVKPYVEKADSLADTTLNHVDSRFPIIKEQPGTIVGKVKDYAYWPVSLVGGGKDYILDSFSSEYERASKTNGRGVRSLIIATFRTQLKVASDGLSATAAYLTPQDKSVTEKAKGKAAEVGSSAKQTKDSYAQKAQQAVN